jgi:hypothetical protein
MWLDILWDVQTIDLHLGQTISIRIIINHLKNSLSNIDFSYER